MTAAERSALAAVTPPAKVITLNGTNSNADNANIRAAIAAIKASGQPGEIQMSGDFKIGYSGDKSGIDPDAIPYLKLKGRGYCRWYKGLAATTSGVAAGDDPGDGSAYALLARGTDDGPSVRKTLIIEGIIFEGDLATTMRHLATTAGSSPSISTSASRSSVARDAGPRKCCSPSTTATSSAPAASIFTTALATASTSPTASMSAASTPTSNGSSTTASPPTSTPATPAIPASSAPRCSPAIASTTARASSSSAARTC